MNELRQRLRRLLFGATGGKALRDGAWVLGGQMLGLLPALATDSVLFHLLPQSERGLFSAARGLLLIFMAFTDLGVSLTTIHFGARREAAGDASGARFVFRRALWLRGAAACLIGILACVFSPKLSAFPLAAWNRPTVVFALAAILLGQAVTAWGADVAQARRRFKYWFAQQTFAAFLRAAALISLTCFGIRQVEPLLWGAAGAAFCSGGFILFLQRDVLRGAVTDKTRRRMLSAEMRGFGRWAGLGTLLAVVGGQTGLLLLQGLLGRGGETAIYDGALRLAMLLPLFTGALTTVLLPRASTLQTPADCRAYLGRVLRVMPPAALAAAGGLALSAPLLVPLLWGHKYNASISLLPHLCVAYGLGMVFNPLMLILYPLGRLPWIIALNAFDLLLGIVLNFILIPRWGAAGAVVAVWAEKTVSSFIAGGILLAALRSADKKARGEAIKT